ncbi:hypothetical protein H0X10_03625 [Candidatus Saccharibacteria bacterium]|nr:hypothetical protein [Candidatus Saccharibacteria bacterium]
MNVFDGNFAGSFVFSDGLQPAELTPDQRNVIEENAWEQVTLAVNHGDIAQDDAEMYLYQLHNRIQHLGEFSLRAS